MNQIKKSISAEPVTNFKREACHEAFVITSNLEMIQQVRIVTLDENNVPISERIAQDENLTPLQKQNALQRYQDQIITKQTAGAFVELKTGRIVEEPVEGVISQRDYFQNITLGDLKALGLPVSDKTPVAHLLYALIGNEIGNIDTRGDL